MLNKSSISEKTKDLLTILLLAIIVFCLAFISLGFYQSGIRAPIAYRNGGDATYIIAEIKKTGVDHNWWNNSYLGAPFSATSYDWPFLMLGNTERLNTIVLYAFLQDIMATLNIQYILMFVFGSINGYIVLRIMGISRILSVVGAILFGFSPYIYERSVAHFFLSATYLIPFSILLCLLSFDDILYNKLFNGFSERKKHAVCIVLCFLIANNGTGYYPFFTCFLLLLTLTIRYISDRNIRCLKRGGMYIFVITGTLVLELVPVFLYQKKYGDNLEIVKRNYIEQETSGLKIRSFFTPIDDHQMPYIRSFINKMSSTPLTNENITAYLGIFAFIGLLLSFLCLLSAGYYRECLDKKGRNLLLSKLIIMSVLFGSIGGLFAVVSLITGIYYIRGHNRISIFIMFMCIIITCSYLDDFFIFVQQKTTYKKG